MPKYGLIACFSPVIKVKLVNISLTGTFSPTHICFGPNQQFKRLQSIRKIINFWYTFGWKWWVISFRDYLGLSDACSYDIDDVIGRADRFGFQNFCSPGQYDQGLRLHSVGSCGPRLMWVFAGHTCHLLILSWGGSRVLSLAHSCS